MLENYKEYIDVLRIVWPDWEIQEPIGSGAFAIVFRASRKDRISGEKDSAIKIIRIPHDFTDWDRVLSEGKTLEQTTRYFQDIVERSLYEIRAMENLSGNTNIVNIRDYKRYFAEENNTWYILIRMELLDKIDPGRLNESNVIRLGKDICTALSICREKNIVHRDISLDNIFFHDGNYKLGDFGVSKVLEGTKRSMASIAGKPLYMAPEIYNATLVETDIDSAAKVDIYSLGILMYRLCNEMCYPFENTEGDVSAAERNQAFKRRVIDGETLPPPKNASPELALVIQKACQANPDERYGSAQEMLEALQSITLSNKKVPGPVPVTENTGSTGKSSSKKGSVTPKWIAVLCAMLAIFIIGFVCWEIWGRHQEKPAEQQTVSVEKTTADSDNSTATAPQDNELADTPKTPSTEVLPEVSAEAQTEAQTGAQTETRIETRIEAQTETLAEALTKAQTEVQTEVTAEAPTEALTEAPAASPDDMPAYVANTDQPSSPAIGSIVTLGNYEQDNDTGNGKEVIEWIVLDSQDGQYLLLSRYGLDVMQYNEYQMDITWEHSTIRSWLNNEFRKTAFTEEEQSAISLHITDNNSNQGYGKYDETKGGNDTSDYVFLLSYHEAFDLYFHNDSDRICIQTEYARAKNPYRSEDSISESSYYGWWWLRSPGEKQHTVSGVNITGVIKHAGASSSRGVVRPALWLDSRVFSSLSGQE